MLTPEFLSDLLKSINLDKIKKPVKFKVIENTLLQQGEAFIMLSKEDYDDMTNRLKQKTL